MDRREMKSLLRFWIGDYIATFPNSDMVGYLERMIFQMIKDRRKNAGLRPHVTDTEKARLQRELAIIVAELRRR